MTKTVAILFSLLLQISFAFADFKTFGEIDSFDYNPKAYDLRHAISYYIPASYYIDLEKEAKVLILMHGGGASTSTYDSAKRVAEMYLEDFVDYAEKNNVIVVAPSTSVGWSFITRVFVKETIDLVKKQLSRINTNKIVLFGHSMGAMGITREGHWFADQVNGIFPTAGGMQPHFLEKTHYVNTYFNVPFLHINGEQDHFDKFKVWSLAVENKIKSLEKSYVLKSKYKLLFHPGGHNYVLSQVESELDRLFERPRNLYQNLLFPLFGNLYRVDSQYGPDTSAQLNRYFWLKADMKKLNKEYVVSGKAQIINNKIYINMDTSMLNSLDIYLSSKMIDFDQEISVYVNDEFKMLAYKSVSSDFKEQLIKEYQDPNFIFDSKITLRFP